MNKDKNNLLERLKALENKVNLQENEINNLKRAKRWYWRNKKLEKRIWVWIRTHTNK